MQRKFDLTRWSHGIPAFGPEVRLVQRGIRPASFHSCGDIAPNLDALAKTCSLAKLLDLLHGQKTPPYQRVSYFLAIAGQSANGAKVLANRPTRTLSHVVRGDGKEATFSATHQITDQLVAPFLARFGKA